jgi:DNA-binding NarL/FixJ family response regulator
VPGPAIRVLIADDHPVVREGLAAILGRFAGLEVVARVGDGLEAIAEARRLRPQVVLCDLRMPGADGVEVARRLRAELPGTAVLILSTFDDSPGILAALTAGARGYLLKDAPPEELHRAIVACLRGDTVLHPSVAGKVARVHGPASPSDAEEVGELTPREIEVLALLARGLANKEIAAELGVAESTVKTHLSSLFRKLGAADRVQAVTEGMRRGYLDPPAPAGP